jgi:RNA polymerase II-associated factor 1
LLKIKQHYSKPNVVAVQEFKIFPDFDLWRHSCAQVIFDDDPAPRDHSIAKQTEEMSQAVIKGLKDKNSDEQFVAYFLPTEETLEKRHRDQANDVDYDADDEYDFKLTREYTWNIKTKGNREYEENYYFIMKNDGIYYNELETRVRLSKRRNKDGKIRNSRLIINYRPYNKHELRLQSVRARTINEEEEEISEDEEEEEENEEEQEEENEQGSDKQSDEESGDNEQVQVDEKGEDSSAHSSEQNEYETSQKSDGQSETESNHKSNNKSDEEENGKEEEESTSDESDQQSGQDSNNSSDNQNDQELSE